MSSLWQNEQAHNGCSWKTCGVCSPPTKVSPTGKSSMRWLTAASMRSGHVFEPTSLWVPVTVGNAGSVLPTPVVNDMGAGKTVEWWDAWIVEQREKHRNGNGHGKSLSIEVQRLLPTPQAWDHKSFGPNVDWEKRAEKHADSVASVLMNLPSDDGSSGSDG